MFNPYGAIAAYDGIAAAARTYSEARLKERTTAKAGASLQLAAEFQEKHPGASPELALLAGILQEGTNVAAMALRLRRADSARISELADSLDFSPSQPAREFEGIKRVDSYLTKAWEEATRLNHGYIGPEHILFAIAATVPGAATLGKLQVDASAVRETTLYLINERS